MGCLENMALMRAVPRDFLKTFFEILKQSNETQIKSIKNFSQETTNEATISLFDNHKRV